MKNKAYKKSITREIISSKARFISILAIIFLGVAFYTGIKSAGPDLKDSINEFFSEQNLMDSKIVSSLGLNENDLNLLENNDKILDYYATHSVDVNLTNTNNVVRFMEYNPNDSVNMNKPIVIEGRLPENSGEIALDENALKENENLKIGDDYTIESDVDLDEYFNKKTFKIVGFVQSPMYIENISRGTTTVGKGSIDYFAILNNSDISMDVYTEIYVRFKNVESFGSYSDEYKEKMEENNKYLEDLYSNRVTERIQEIKSEAQKEFDKAYKEMLSSGIAIEDIQKGIDTEKEKLNDLDNSKYYFFDREDNPGYSTYKGSIDSLDKIASVFPVFFFLVAVLICLTTMTRMVEENRVEIGTLKALGYRDIEISKKFVVYAALASIAGSVIGILVGSSLLPYIINQAYSSTFTLPNVNIYFYPSYIIQSLVASIVCTVGAALIVLKGELIENPSNLMRTKVPKLGKKILLERITPLWERLNFNQKVTFRNLFRYKQRMLMTILGISGCMAMLVAGLALEKSTSSVMDIQFGKLIKYDAMVVFKDNSTALEDDEYNKSLTNLKGYESSLNIYQDSVTFSKEGLSKQTATMYVPENTDELNKYILLNDRESGTEFKLSNNGVIINEKLARLLNASVGDTIIVTDSDKNDYEVKVDNIVENYAGHYIYLSPSYYKEIFNSDPIYNAQLLKLNSDREDDNAISTTLMDNDKVVNVTLVSKMRSLSESADLGLVMIVIIVASGSLAFVVLYNLININVSERIREISTIKVLGFYDSEVAMYIFRENIILTILGILSGSFLGKILYVFLVSTAETDNMMMIPTVGMSGYIIAGLITMFFAILVMIMMHMKLKKINMIEALKSID
ncbi:ABC transporter permease [Clostridium sp. AL.422]|uniref:ABC transporter permease n=1 Tax=Clostridium TaxID=1485 RepID=UPI00293DB579|nr:MULTISPECIES: ABC transporter permease [unclassified Clostridium]MDV4152071.1 ABC transporter permease [Clostridium sp. AL.422]